MNTLFGDVYDPRTNGDFLTSPFHALELKVKTIKVKNSKLIFIEMLILLIILHTSFLGLRDGKIRLQTTIGSTDGPRLTRILGLGKNCVT